MLDIGNSDVDCGNSPEIPVVVELAVRAMAVRTGVVLATVLAAVAVAASVDDVVQQRFDYCVVGAGPAGESSPER
jgi:hypothetical protein